MKSSITLLLQLLFLSLTHLTVFSLSTSQPTSQHGLENILHQISQWRNNQVSSQDTYPNINTIIACIICFIAATVSTACGVGGGSLFLPILTIVAGLSLKTATAFSSFMVTAGALSYVIYALFFMDKSAINYEVVLLSEPCLLLGVSIGVLCNIMFPEWLITALFALLLAITTTKTVQSGCNIWRDETEKERVRFEVEEGESWAEVPLLVNEREGKGNGAPKMVPWKDLVVLVLIWMCFFVLRLLLGNKSGKVCNPF